jgi:glycine hydroxymethyltransferase
MGEFFRFRGEGLSIVLDALLTCRLATMAPGDAKRGFLLDPAGRVIDAVAVRYIGRTVQPAPPLDEDEFVLFCHRKDEVAAWLSSAFDGSAVLEPGAPEVKAKCVVAIGPGAGDSALSFEESRLDSPDAARLVDITKPFFVGQRAIAARFPAPALPSWQPPHIERPKPLPKTLLGAVHERIGVSQWGPFGSCTMPIQYAPGPTAIAAEHLATRCSAALYDVSHMLPIIIKGRDARAFLDMCLVNSVSRLRVGRCQYQAICLPDGAPQDDLYLNYLEHDARSGEDVFLLVGNSGHELDYHNLAAVAAGSIAIDPEMAFKCFEGDVHFVSRLETPEPAGPWSQPLYSLSLQGPRSRDVLLDAVDSGDRERIAALKFNTLATGVRIKSTEGEVIVTFTGYCGEPAGYEIYATASSLVGLWQALHGRGAVPAGLGARDSTRQEAGLPLFGHEIAGPLEIPLSGGRYPKIVAFHKPFFLGRKGALGAERRRTKRVFLLAADGPRKVSQGWPVYALDGSPLGHVTSTSTIRPAKTDIAQAYLEEARVRMGDKVVVMSPSRPPRPGQPPDGRVFTVSTWDKSRDYDCGG